MRRSTALSQPYRCQLVMQGIVNRRQPTARFVAGCAARQLGPDQVFDAQLHRFCLPLAHLAQPDGLTVAVGIDKQDSPSTTGIIC
ncbi:MAG: hypothetical protein KDA57_11195 [Planctomycetales bacterium]|nr:hypothetical protein [Planctomycetales bacterium]